MRSSNVELIDGKLSNQLKQRLISYLAPAEQLKVPKQQIRGNALATGTRAERMVS